MKPERDPVFCEKCGEEIISEDDISVTSVGIYHQKCAPNPEDL